MLFVHKIKVTFELFFLHDSDERDPFEETSVWSYIVKLRSSPRELIHSVLSLKKKKQSKWNIVHTFSILSTLIVEVQRAIMLLLSCALQGTGFIYYY